MAETEKLNGSSGDFKAVPELPESNSGSTKLSNGSSKTATKSTSILKNHNNNDHLKSRLKDKDIVDSKQVQSLQDSKTISGKASRPSQHPGSGSKPVSKLHALWISIRPGSLMTSLIPIVLGTILALKVTGQVSLPVLLSTTLTAISVHAAGNLVNTYWDYMKGIDTNRAADDRTLVDRLLTPEEVANLGVLFYIIGCCGFLAASYCSPTRIEILALLYFGGISSSFLYTGGIGLKYIALGDLIIMLTFGPVSVLYAYVAQTGTIRLFTLLYAIPLALNAEAVLHSNNTRDIEDDRRAGCYTLAVLIGPTASHILFPLLLFVPYILFLIGALHWSCWLLLPIITLPKAFAIEKQFRTGDLRFIPRQMARQSLYFGIFYLAACLVSHPMKLPGLFH